MDYAGSFQEKLLSLTLAASTGSIQEKEITDFSAAIANPALKWPSITLEVGASYVGANPAGLKEWEAIFEHARQAGAPLQPLRLPNTYAKLRTIDTPTLVLAAGADQLAPPGLMRLWSKHIKNHEWAIIPAAGHSAAWEEPDQFNRIVLEFVAKHTKLRGG
jgi:pimeloyl-ACP methyl ester carboxylesterase